MNRRERFHQTLGQLLEHRATLEPDGTAFGFYSYRQTGTPDRVDLTYGALFDRAKRIASGLVADLEYGDRALIVCAPGLDYITAFFACQLAGIIAVPAYPPRNIKHMERLEAILADADAATILCQSAQLEKLRAWSSGARDLAFRSVDIASPKSTAAWAPFSVDPGAIAFLQYTSGTTGSPKGVMVTHNQVLENLARIYEVARSEFNPAPGNTDVVCGWLPPYHDMGLVGTILYPVYANVPAYLMQPASFLQRPLRWLQAISETGATMVTAPNFAYQMCCDDIASEDLDGLDLSSLRITSSGAEPVQEKTLNAFATRFRAFGFDASTFCPSYGMAEFVLTATAWQPQKAASRMKSASRDNAGCLNLMSLPSKAFVNEQTVTMGDRKVVTCGSIAEGQAIAVVDPDTRRKLKDTEVGEIWLSGPSMASGYWNRPELTQEVFQAALKGDIRGRVWLRTGDMGALVNDQLFVLGRRKEMVIIRGQNHYAVDLEITANASDPMLGNDRTIAFGIERDGLEQLVLVHELSRSTMRRFDPNALARSMRRAVLEGNEIDVANTVFIKPASLPRSTSGKLQHLKARAQFMEDTLNEVARWDARTDMSVLTDPLVIRRFAGLDRSAELPGPIEIKAALKGIAGVSETSVHWRLGDAGLFWLDVGLQPAESLDTEECAMLGSCAEQAIMRVSSDSVPFLKVSVRSHASDTGDILLPCLDHSHATGEPPEGDMEQLIASAISAFTGRADVYRDTNFLDIGADSLKAARLIGYLEEKAGVVVSLQTVFEAPTVRQLASALATCTEASTGPILPADRSVPISLSPQQERLWFLNQLDQQAGLAYNEVHAFRLNGPVDLVALNRAIERLVGRHESLRTRFSDLEGGPVQIVEPLENSGFRFLVENAEGITSADLNSRVRELCEERFDLQAGPVFRARWLVTSKTTSLLVIGGHHAVLDGWSLRMLIGELTVLYREETGGEAAELPDQTLHYADYSVWQRHTMTADLLETETAWWSHHLAGSPPAITLPFDRPRPEKMDYSGGSIDFSVPEDTIRGLRSIARENGATLFMALETAFAALLSRFGAGPDVLIGTAVAGRSRPELENLCGFFVNTVALRNRIGLEHSFIEQLVETRATVLNAFAHDRVPFEAVVDAVSPVRSLSHAPLLQVLLVLQNMPQGDGLMLGETQAIPFCAGGRSNTQFELSLELTETGAGLTGILSYARQVFERETAARIVTAFRRALDFVTKSPETALRYIPLLGASERRLVTKGVNATDRAYPLDQTILDLFAGQVQLRPGAWAVSDARRRATYAELDAASNRLARHLIAHGAGPEIVIGVCLDRSTDLIVCLFGILKAGAAYLPLDPDGPADRLNYMAQDANVKAVVTSRRHSGRLEELAVGTGPMLVILDSEETADALADCPSSAITDVDRHAPLTPQTLAYVIYTSGSTGKPKGVMVGHKELTNRLAWMQEDLPIGPDDVILQKTPFTFDVSVWEFFWWAANGASAVLLAPGAHRDAAKVAQAMSFHHVSVLHFVPSMFDHYLDLLESGAGLASLENLKAVFASGEALSARAVQRFHDITRMQGRSIALCNLYGPTEAAVDVTAYRTAGDETLVPIGAPVPNTQIYVVDENLVPVPVGVPGELLIGGVQVSRGYLGRPGLSAETFVADPFSGKSGQRLYRTGDLARWLSPGTLEYLGRIDAQVKIRGMRVELGEIEAALAGQGGVAQATVAICEKQQGEITGSQLIAFLVPECGKSNYCEEIQIVEPETFVDLSVLRAHLKRVLPEHMVPSGFVGLSHMPLTTSGKVDRKALPTANVTVVRADYEEPKTDTEKNVANGFSCVLGLERIGRHDSFFSLGGDSLSSVRLVNRLRKTSRKAVEVRHVFEAQSVAELAVLLENLGNCAEQLPLVRANRSEPISLSWQQEQLWFLNQLDNRASAAYHVEKAFHLAGTLDKAALARAFKKLLSRHEVLRTVFVSDENGTPHQIICPEDGCAFELDLDQQPDLSDAELEEDVARRLAQPFNLETGPLFRLSLVSQSETSHVLLIGGHHIVLDGWSLGILVKDLTAFYEEEAGGPAAKLSDLVIQYADFAMWERKVLSEDRLKQEESWWKRELSGAPAAIELPFDRPRPQNMDFAGGAVELPVAADVTQRLKALAQANGATLFMVLETALAALLSRLGAGADVVIGTAVAGRSNPELEGLCGFFANTVALRNRVDLVQSFAQQLRDTKITVLNAFAHDNTPFEVVVDAVAPVRSLGHSPVTQVMLVLQNTPDRTASIRLGEAVAKPFGLEAAGGAKFELMLDFLETEAGLSGKLTYASQVFDDSTAARIGTMFTRVLHEVSVSPEARLHEIPLLTALETTRVTRDFNDTYLAFPQDVTVVDLFAAQAASTPGKTVLIDGDRHCSYAGLDAASNRLARHLIALGVGPELIVGVCLERSSELIIALLGILKAGGAYLPLDPDYPDERMAFMLEDADAALVVSTNAFADRFGRFRVVVPSADTNACPIAARGDAPVTNNDRHAPLTSNNLAYVKYTSGSTGKPKGVMVGHREVVSLIHNDYPVIDKTGRLLQTGHPVFDAVTFEYWVPLCFGGCLMLPQDRVITTETLQAFSKDAPIDTLWLTAGLFNSLVKSDPHAFEKISNLIVGGDVVDPHAIAELRPMANRPALFNGYGPTEATTFAVSGPIDPDLDYDRIPIGLPLANTEIYIVDEYMNPVPVGVAGEMWIGGVEVTRGYLGRPGLTADKFIADPFSGKPGARLYRSGDLGRWRQDGTLEFLDRIDTQVKIRGMRVELGEIEAALLAQDGISHAAVLARKDAGAPGSEPQLMAYIVPEGYLPDARDEERQEPGERDFEVVQPETFIDLEELRSRLQRSLPHYMVPTSFVGLSNLPLTPSGKVNRKALPNLEGTLARPIHVPPQTETETLVANAFADLLGVENVGRADGFFALGGDSLKSVRLVAQLERASGKAIAVKDVFETQSVASLAALIDAAVSKNDDLGYAPLVAEPDHRHEPFPLTDIQQAYYLGRQGAGAVGDVSCYAFLGFEIPDLHTGRLEQVFDELVAAHPALRTIFHPDLTQQVLKDVPPVAIPVTDLSQMPLSLAEKEWEALVAARSHRVLPADRWPLFELAAVKMPDASWRLTFGIDLLIGDAVSLQLLLGQAFARYFGIVEEVQVPEIRFRDLVLHAEAHKQSQRYDRARTYWVDRLDALPSSPVLPHQTEARPEGATRFSNRQMRLDGARWRIFKGRAAEAGLTPVSVLATVYAEVLARWSGMDNLLLNVTVMGRKPVHEAIWEVIGDFTSVSLLAAQDCRQGAFRERARRLQGQLAEDLDHSDFSGIEVLRALGALGRRAEGPHAVFTSTLGLTTEQDPLLIGREHGIELLVSSGQTPQVLLDCGVSEGPDGLNVNWSAPIGLTPEAVLDDMFAAFHHLLDCLAGERESWNALPSVWLPENQTDILQNANADNRPLPKGRLQDGVFVSATAYFNRAALLGLDGNGDIHGGTGLSFGRLSRCALALARTIETKSLEHKDGGLRPVAILMEKGWEQVVAALAILEAEAAFLPIAANQPSARIATVFANAGVETVLCDRANEHLAHSLAAAGDIDVICVEPGLLNTDFPGSARRNTSESVSPLDPAYVIYTSGSTGTPKGVVINHRAARTTLSDMETRFDVGPDDRVLWVSDLGFDLSIFDLFSVLGRGGAVVLPAPGSRAAPELWGERAAQHQVTIWNSVPQLADMAVGAAAEGNLSSLRLALLSGDWIPLPVPGRIRSAAPHCQIVSLGGATEAAIWSIYYPINDVDPSWASIPYGRPLSNQQFHVLGADFNPCPILVPGQLYIGGDGLADGYLNDPARTAERFVFHPRTGERLYDTGDLGRYLENGDIEFLGRADFQVKIRGHRVELGEIETVLQTHPQIETVIVSAAGERDNKRLVAHIVAKTQADAWDPQDPVILTGKTDRAAFTLAGHGRPGATDGVSIPLSGNVFEPERRAAWIARQSYRQFEGGALSGDELESWLADAMATREHTQSRLQTGDGLGRLLGALQAMPVDGSMLPKRFYPSAGGLYPVRTYLQLDEKDAAKFGMVAGAYVYDPVDHALLACPCEAKATVMSSIAFVGHLPAIAPLYGTWSPEACALEAGTMRAALSEIMPGLLQPVDMSNLDEDGLRQSLGLGSPDEDLLLAVLELGGAEQEARPAGPGVAVYMSVKPGAIEGLAGGVYRHDRKNGLIALKSAELEAGDFPGLNRAIFENASLCIVLAQIGDISADAVSCQYSAGVALGRMAQTLARTGSEWNIGTCAVGGIDPARLNAAVGLPENGGRTGPAMHVLLAGPIDPSQEKQWQPAGMASADKADPHGIKSWLRDRLPEHMVPAAMMAIDHVPLTANGKVDRKALPDIDAAASAAVYASPRDRTEEVMCALIRDVIPRDQLSLDRIGIDDNFFDMGGHSIFAAQFAARVEKELGIHMPVRLVFESPTVRQMSERLADTAEPALPKVQPVDPSGRIPASFEQERMWLANLLHADQPVYNEGLPLVLRGPVNTDALVLSVLELLDRYQVLRTRLVTRDGRLWQEIDPPGTLTLAFEDWSDRAASPDELEAEASKACTALISKPYDLGSEHPCRALVIKISNDLHVWCLAVHHSVGDNWSLSHIMQSDFLELYRAASTGEAADLPAISLTYSDYASWQRSDAMAAIHAEELDWWKQKLHDAPTALDLPFDRPRPFERTHEGQRFEMAGFDPAEWRMIEDYAVQRGATPFMVFVAALSGLLARVTRSSDIVLGTPHVTKPAAALWDEFGYFGNTLALRTQIDGEWSFNALLDQAKAVVNDAIAHENIPFEQISSALPGSPSNVTPVFQVMIVMRAYMDDRALLLPDVDVGFLGQSLPNISKYDLMVDINPGPSGVAVSLEYATDVFDAPTIERVGGMLKRFLSQALKTPEAKLVELPVLGGREEQRILRSFNDTAAVRPQDQTFADLFVQHAATFPDNLAVVDGNQRWSYGDVDRASNRLARFLIDLGVGPDHVVAVCLERSTEMIVSLFAILKAGGAYLPLDPGYPAARRAFMIEDAGAGVVITSSRQSRIPDRAAGGRETLTVVLDEKAAASRIGTFPDAPVRVMDRHGPLTPENLAYILYTSGSTGKPKGVMVAHSSLLNHLLWTQDYFGFAPYDALVLKTNYTFDVSVFELFGWCLSGASVWCLPVGAERNIREVYDFLTETPASYCHFPGAQLDLFLSQCLQTGLPNERLRILASSGEAVPVTAVQKFVELDGEKTLRLENLYGPTEGTVHVTAQVLDQPMDTVPIGKPVANTQAYVVDGYLNPVPVGAAGELLIGGTQVSRGYLRRPGQTAEAFIADPFSGVPGSRLYRTGDLVRWRSDGVIDFLGRTDTQVKIRGMRVEPGEIEASLARHAPVAQAAVLARASKQGGNIDELVAYLVPDHTAAGVLADAAGVSHGDLPAGERQAVQIAELRELIDLDTLQSRLRDDLPEHMVPARFVGLSRLPSTPSGKVDRKALPQVDGAVAQAAYEAPRTGTEQLVARVYAEVLGVARVGRGDGFFAMGGNSLGAVHLVTRLEEVSGKTVAIRDLFEAPTVKDIARRMDEGKTDYTPLIPLGRSSESRGTAPRTLICFPPAAGLAFPYGQASVLEAWRRFGDVVAVQARGYGRKEEAFTSYAEMVDCYAAEITRSITGSAVCIGWSLGGFVAHDVATRLQAAGMTIEGVVILDSNAGEEVRAG
ncbi:non-ribosomal peptide synthetase, partial [Roseibium sp. RKSG952]|uniref:non-ribosomal peptide synthetase n=1 Tax=Roseibium sp. RKSG952 TaxID=2529384 RepID=UPI0018AD2321